MKTTRILSGVCASAMVLSMAATAFAADSPTDKTLKVAGSTSLPTINMVMPTNPSVILNPYKLTVDLGNKTDAGADAQITSPTMYIQNLSDVAIQVCAKAGVKKSGGVEIATASTASETDASKKSVYVGMVSQIIADTKTPITFDATLPTASAAPTDGGNGFFVLPETAAWADGLGDAADATSPVAATEGVNKLAAAEKGKLAAADGVFAFRFTGDTNPKCTTWDAKDKIDAEVVFKFVPLINTPSAG